MLTAAKLCFIASQEALPSYPLPWGIQMPDGKPVRSLQVTIENSDLVKPEGREEGYG